MGAHTKGPFTANCESPNWYSFDAPFFEVTAADGLILAFVKSWKDSPKEAIANASLFAASNDLLSLAKQWVALDSEFHPDRHAADKRRLLDETRAAIAKANGEQS